MTTNRSYSCKDVEMLMVSKTIAESFRANMDELSAIRTDWSEQYAAAIIARIDNAIENYLGIDARKDLREATTNLTAALGPARRDVSFLKTQIDEDFRREPALRTEILRTLGFATLLKRVQNGGQEALIQLLYHIKTNLTEPLRHDIEARGVNPALIDRIIACTDTLIQANVTQESLKGITREVTQETVQAFNSIYTDIIGICKKASLYYQYEPIKRQQFTFAKVLANLGGGTPKTANSVPTP